MPPRVSLIESEARGDNAVRATNDDAFASKVAAASRGYFFDPFLSPFLDCGVRSPIAHGTTHIITRPPLINRGTFTRVSIFHRLVSTFLRAAPPGPVQVISFGAGYDTLPFHLLDGHTLPPMRYVEVDFAQVIQSKAEVVSTSSVFRRLFSHIERGSGAQLTATAMGKSGAKASVYALRACDLRKVSDLRDVLTSAGVDFAVPTLFLAEIVLIYMSPAHSDSVIKFAVSQFSGSICFINYEHCTPDDAFGRQMTKNIAARGSPLLGISTYPTIRSQIDRFKAQGWLHVDAVSMLDAFDRFISRSQVAQLQRVEPLDEVEEWRLIMTHYFLLVAKRDGGEAERPHFLDAVSLSPLDVQNPI